MAEHYIVHQAKGCVYMSQNTCCIICHLTGQDSSSFFTWECGCNQPVIPGIFSTSAGHWTHWTALRPQTSQEQRNPTWTPPARPEDVPMCFLWAGRFWETLHTHTHTGSCDHQAHCSTTWNQVEFNKSTSDVWNDTMLSVIGILCCILLCPICVH